ncbi:MAG: hypothetical protein ISQ32_03390 [Rickettsiales bacterium]|nr:hypothetical protein [Rickettsiales bacterium]
MKVFAIYTKTNSVKTFDDLVAVQKSFNVWATLFNFWWALFKRQYFMALIMFLILGLVGRLNAIGFLNDISHIALIAYLLVVFGIESGSIIGNNLIRKNYIFHELVLANNSLDARYQFSKKRL